MDGVTTQALAQVQPGRLGEGTLLREGPLKPGGKPRPGGRQSPRESCGEYFFLKSLFEVIFSSKKRTESKGSPVPITLWKPQLR